MKSRQIFIVFTIASSLISMGISCQVEELTTGDAGGGGTTTTTNENFIYIASGTTYAGAGVTMSTPSHIISKLRENGSVECIVKDFSATSPDSPASIANYDSNYILVAIDGAGVRRVSKIKKDCSGDEILISNNTTALSAQLRDINVTPSGNIAVNVGTKIELFNTAGTRLLVGANPWISGITTGACATSTTLFPKFTFGPSNNFLIPHAAASTNNQTISISSTGYASTADCLGIVEHNTVSVNHYPTAILRHSSGKVFISFGNTTGTVHQIYAYDVSAGTITNQTGPVYNDPTLINGITAMVEMPDSTILVASGTSTYNTVEQLQWNGSALVRVGTAPFLNSTIYTKSISKMIVAN